MKLKNIIDSLTAKFAALAVTFGLAGGAWAADPVTIQDASGNNISVYEVSSGFYQNGATYDSTTDFYITSKDGLKYFRDWVNGTSAAMNHYYDSGFLTLTLASFATNNGMSGKNVHLLADIDLTGEVWQPIGSGSGKVPDVFNGSWKAHFYGNFYGYNHVVCNMDTSGSEQGDKYSRFPQGFFGQIVSNGMVIDGLILENVKVVSNFTTYGYAGAIVGDLGSNPFTISNCKVRGEIELRGGYTGAVYGIGNANIVNCVVDADYGSVIVGNQFAGGLVGAERCSPASNLNITGNTIRGAAVSSSQFAGSIVGAMADGAAGVCSITENDIVDCSVNGNDATLETLIAENTGATTALTVERNTVRTTLIVETGDLTPAEEITEETKEVDYTVPVTVKDRTGNVISETAAQEIAVSVGNDDVADITLTSVKLNEVVAKVLDAVSTNATSVTAIEILVKSAAEATGASSITYEVHPEAVVTVSKTGEEDTTSTVALSNDDLAEGETFTFDLDVTSLGVAAGTYVQVTHKSEGYADEVGLYEAKAGANSSVVVRVTTTHFSEFVVASTDATPVAKIGDVGYATIADACAAVSENAPLTWVDDTAWPDATPVWYNSNFYATLSAAINAANEANASTVALIYVKPNMTLGKTGGSHENIKTSITIYGNNASLGVTWEPTIEQEGAQYHTLTKDVTFAIYNLHDGAGAWGTRSTAYTSTIIMCNCTNAHEVLLNSSINGNICRTDVTVRNCTFDGNGKAHGWPIAPNTPGTWLVENCTFSNLNQTPPINFNNKNGGELSVTMRNCTFTDCGVSGDGSVIRLAGLAGTVVGTFDNLTFSGSRNKDIVIGNSSASKNVAAVTYSISNTACTMTTYQRETGTVTDSTLAAESTYTGNNAPVVAQIVTNNGATTNKYETVEAALAAAQTAGATIEVLADSTETPDHALEVLMGGNITLTSTAPVRVEIAPTAKTSSVDTDGMAYIRSASADVRRTFTIGENVTLAFPATAVGKGAMYIGYSAATPADMVINGRLELYEPYVGSLSTLTVNPSGSIKSISECLIVRWGATVDIVGTGAEWSDANPQAEFGYVWLQGGVTTLKDTYAKGGAWVQTWNRNADKVGQYGDTTLALDNSVLATSKIDNQVVIAMDCDSQIVTPVVQNTGSINIDATGITAPFKAIDYTGSGTMALANYGTVNVTGGEAYVEESDLWVKKLPVAQIVTDAGATTTKYATLAAAVADAQDGDTIEMIADVTGENVTVTKSVTITGASDAEGNPAITLENTQLTLSGTMVELAVTNLAFTGSSYINANNGKALTVDHVTAVVDPTKCGNCTRSAFIVLSATEHTTGLDLTVTHSTIVNTSGTDSYGAAIFGWAYLKSATICDNVLGSDSYRFRFIAVKLMNAVDGATYTIERNMVYGTNARYRFYAFDLYQNCSRDNSYTAVSKDNVVDVTATGSYDFFVFYIERNGSVSTKTIVIDSDSTLNGKAVTLNDFRNELNVNAGFYGAGVVYDANGKMTGGTFNRAFSDEELAEFAAEGLRSFAVGDGIYTLDVPVAQIGDVKYASFEKAIADVQDGETIVVLGYNAETMVAPEGWKFVTENDVTTLVRKVYVAQVVGGQSYETIAEAIAAASEGGTVQVLVDCSIDAHIDVTKNLTLDLNGKTVVNNVNSARAIDLNADGVALTVKANGGGMVIAAGNSYGFFRMQKPNDRIVLDGGFYRGHTDRAALFRYNNSDQSMVLSNVTAEAVGSALMANYYNGGNGHYNNLEIVGGSFMTSGANPATVDSEVFRLYGMNGSIKDAVIVCNITSPSGGYNGCMNIQRNTGSEFVIDGCAISNLVAKTASGQNTWASCLTVAYDAHVKVLNCDLYSAQYGVYVFSSGATVELENSNLKADYKALYSQLAVNGSNGDNAVSSGIIKVKSGLVDGTISADYWNFDSTKYVDFFAAGIQIEGGKFKNFVVECPDTPNTIMAISGGVFDHPVIQRFCAENYEPADNTDALTKDEYPYTVALPAVAQIGDVTYETLAGAFAAAQDGDTITLLADCETGSQYTLTNPLVLRAKNATLDLNGKTITATGNFSFLISGDNDIVTNGTIQAGANTDKTTGINSYAIVLNGCDGVKLTGLTINGGVSVGGSTGGTPNAASATNVVIEDCTVTSGDFYAVCAQQNSTVTIASGSYTANTVSSNSGTLYASFVGTDGPKGTIYVTGGMFAGKIPSGNKAGDIVISGGVYSVKPDAKFCAVGYEVVANADAAYPWTVAHVNNGYIVEDEDGEGYAVIPAVAVDSDSDWIKENVKPAGATATPEEIETALNKTDEKTKLKKWEAYVLNQTEPIKIESVGDAGALTTTLGDAKEGTGLAVTYSLVKIQGGTTNDTACAKDKFTADLETGLYKVRVHFKSDASASEVTVDSVNTVGVLKTQPTGQFVVVPVPFKELGGDDAPVKVASYIRSGLATGDTLHVYNGSNYDSWTYNGTSSSWEKTTNMTVNDENTASTSESAEPSVAALSRGSAAILRRAAGNTAPLVFVGDYTGAAEEQTIAAGWNLVASPSLEAFAPATKFTSGKIQIPGDGLPKNYTFKNGKWGYSGVVEVDAPNGNGKIKMPGRIEVDTLPAGTGFWYFSDSQQQVEW